MQFTKWRISLMVGFIVLGILLATSFYSQQKFKETGPSSRKEGLMESVEALEVERERLKNELSKTRKEVEDYEKQAAANEGILTSFTQENEELKKAAGLTYLTGTGVEITLADSSQLPEFENPNNYIIHDYDLRLAVNALLSGEARGIDVNGQRLISTSAIRCAGNTVMINSTRLSSPYKIKAIGEQDRLLKALQEDEGFAQLLQSYAKAFGLIVKVDKISELRLPSYKGSLHLEYAESVGEK
ncbi:DUF881 domain-containing protein [Candidatus Oleimmundimicrobium sp.]|uniref:DUF881 domain-containing protein n=1 Tax=Candidatus Oleimmundimicrobium sp. TaxID=3060597 RepID=UPI002719BDB8|nr:DUF881 domain-containing protein [Candidatus Oleimmundimicrobium sp.]MDO8885314.1 DUF881 domain-containing protein [Candidatus Oleimmundimicrobium sp.]